MAQSFDHKKIEAAMRERWNAQHLYEADVSDTEKDPYYLLVEFPYPSGDLHIGHWYAFAVTDIYARYLRMIGKNVLFPIGFDAFGLPAENAAIKNGLDPKDWTYSNMDRMREQMRSMGASFDWSKEVMTCDPEYYKWTQWLFAKLYEHGLAVRKNAPVKWCPKDQTVLANEQVSDGKCERCGTEVEEKNLTQWFLKITQYAKRLLEDLEPLPWRQEIKEAQKAWIGESEGARIFFDVGAATNEDAGVIEVFTTRPDTIFGATYVVLAPEHQLVDTLLSLTMNRDAVEQYRIQTSRKTERERSERKDKTGVLLEGIYAVNPATQQRIPVYIADYVLASYGTGAVMAVPAHDERDYEFALAQNSQATTDEQKLPIVQVVMPTFVDETNPPQEGKENTERKIIIGILYDPKTQKYLSLKWKQQNWTTFVTGGIEEGEDAVSAATREIMEETGYTDIALVRELGGVMQSEFYAAHKGVNRKVISQALLFELKSDARQEISPEEAEQYSCEWLTAKEVEKAKFQHAEFEVFWQRIKTGMDAYAGDGLLMNSAQFDGRENRDAMWDVVESVEGERVTNYRIRDWLVSRQRYWGCPIPVVYDPEGQPHLVPSEHLPWILPTDVDFTPTGKSPLATSRELHERVERIFGEGWTPEYDTLDTFVDSSWYFTRYLDPHNEHDFSNLKAMKQWLPVNRYSGGSEHTTMHLLYARFFYKALYDLGLVPTSEPFYERNNRGLILGPDGQKMSKSKGNVINPDEVVGQHGADAVRTYLAFIGPYNEPGNYPWSLDGAESMRKFLDRIAKLADKVDDSAVSPELQKSIAKAAGKVGTDCERFKFNTAVSTLMVLVREFEALPNVPRTVYGDLLKLLAPFAPHIADHLWETIGGAESGSIHAQIWPEVFTGTDDDEVQIIVQINGKKRGELMLSPSATEDEALEAAKQLEAVSAQLASGDLKKIIYVPGRIINLVLLTA